MNTKERLYVVIGGCVGAVLTMAICSFFPLGAQSQGDSFGEISCTGLKVVNAKGNAVIHLDSSKDGGTVYIWGNADSGTDDKEELKKKIALVCGKYQTSVTIGNPVSSHIRLEKREHGASIRICNEKGDALVYLGVARHGGTDIVHTQGIHAPPQFELQHDDIFDR